MDKLEPLLEGFNLHKFLLHSIETLKIKLITFRSFQSCCITRVETEEMGMFHSTQCAPFIFNLDQKFHGLSCFWGFHLYERVQNQLRKICHWASQRVILKKQFYYTKTCMLMSFSSHVYNSKFWKPNNRYKYGQMKPPFGLFMK